MSYRWESMDMDMDSFTERMRVFDGWLVRTVHSERVAMCFVKDTEHLWSEHCSSKFEYIMQGAE